MKILYHHRIRSKDGQFVHIEELTEALRGLGHEIVMVGPAAVERDAFGADAGLVGVLKRLLHGAIYECMELAYGLFAYRRLKAAYLRHCPDCIYERYNLFLPAGVWLKRRYRLPMLLEVNAPLVEERSRFGGLTLARLARWSERFAWRGADFVLPVSGMLAERVRDAGVPDERIVVIRNGIDPERFDAVAASDETRRRLGLDGRLILGFTGFVRSWHGLNQVIDVIAEDAGRRDLHLLVVGDGPARAELESYARERGVGSRLTVTGIVQRGAVADYVSAFDVGLQPDVVPYASPLKLIEYMALGRAIVAPARANIRELLTDGENAVLFDPKAPGSLQRAVERICADASLRRRLGDAARLEIEKQGLTWRCNAQRVEDLFLRLGVGSAG
ncbi:MAG: glycosyltransferase family 4 protein [Alphaproteobacteria bacterium]